MKICCSKLTLAAVAVLIAFTFSSPAIADSLTVGSTYTSGHTFTFNGNPGNDGAGNFAGSQITIGAGSPIALDAMYCIDLFHFIQPGQTYNDSFTNINQLGNVTNNTGISNYDVSDRSHAVSGAIS